MLAQLAQIVVQLFTVFYRDANIFTKMCVHNNLKEQSGKINYVFCNHFLNLLFSQKVRSEAKKRFLYEF